MTEQQATAAGVSLAAVTRGGGSEYRLPGRVSVAPGAEARVDAPLAGVVTAVHVGPGSTVRRGAALATLRSPEGASARADMDAAAAAAEAARAAAARDRALFDRGYMPRARVDVSEANRAAPTPACAPPAPASPPGARPAPTAWWSSAAPPTAWSPACSPPPA